MTSITESSALLLRLEMEEFLYREADLLDSRRFEEWLDLLTDDISYRVLIARNVHSRDSANEYYDGPLDVSWMDEGKELLDARVRQMRTGIHWAEEPVSRTTHLCTNVRVVETVNGGTEPDHVAVKSNFIMYRHRLRADEDWLVGKRRDHLRRVGEDWKLCGRTVFLDQTTLLANNLTTFL
ncbi:3-phenylpropionate/cinnamic acid dioxygenase subunit beta [Micromonospora sp. NPDC048830]|uniref:3-phenylpropionate/cinnamic acid dioxygenase subunit beta n=1 Tax=Micromonospora sp. NPDC048830 TaxID=3364257 RepID=UPI003710B0FB